MARHGCQGVACLVDLYGLLVHHRSAWHQAGPVELAGRAWSDDDQLGTQADLRGARS